jgi:hypothetical protein
VRGVRLPAHCWAKAGERLRQLRGARSLRRFGRVLRVPYQVLARCERGAVFGFDLLVSLGAVGVSLDWLVLGEGDPTGRRRGVSFAYEPTEYQPAWETIEGTRFL